MRYLPEIVCQDRQSIDGVSSMHQSPSRGKRETSTSAAVPPAAPRPTEPSNTENGTRVAVVARTVTDDVTGQEGLYRE